MDPDALALLRRHSGLRIDRSGRWWFRERPVENDRVNTLFHRGLEATDEGLVLRVGEQWAYVETVDDTPWFVERADGSSLRLLAGELVRWEAVVRLEVGALHGADDERVVAVLADGRVARFTRLAALDLAPLLDDAGAVVTVAGRLELTPPSGPS